ncbi:MAG: Hpt domain-containing protein [Devosia sp.]|nr:Hpt domain-containing protein [Devosia sp.]
MAQNNAHGIGQDAVVPGHGHGPIDLDHLARQAMGDPGLTDEVLRLYASMSAVYMGRIEQSTTTAALLEHLHTLKSAAAGIGAWGVRDLARLAEDELRSGGPANPERIEDIAMAVAECSEYIAALLEQAA